MVARAIVRLFFVLSAQTFYTDPEDLADAVNATTSGGTFIVINGTRWDALITP